MRKTNQNFREQSKGKTPIRRPKKCHLCQRMVAAQKYNQHYESCYRYKQQPIQSKIIPKKAQQTKAIPNKSTNIQSSKKQLLNDNQPNNKFRIKNLSKVQTNKPIKVQTINNSKKQLKQEQIIIKKQNNNINNKDNVQQNIKRRQQQDNKHRRSFNQQSPQIYIIDGDQNRIDPFQSQQSQNSLQIQNQPIIINHNNSPPVFIVNTNNNSHNGYRNNRNLFQQQNQSRNRQRNQIIQQSNQISQLVNNTNQIVSFIQGMGGIDDQALQIMIAQLRQLNIIAMQVRDLDQLGSNLGFQMGTVFTRRIRQLQTTIINQIGISLIRRFHQRIGFTQFNNLLDRQPQLRTGFSQSEIQNIFPDKLTLKDSQCSICIQDIKRGAIVKQLQCRHSFHPDCIKHWLQASKVCPMCRQQQIRTNK